MGARSQSAVAGFPRRVTPDRVARTLAGNTTTKNRMRANPAARLVRGSSNPKAPAISQRPVKNTKARGQGKEGGIMRTRSSRIRVKCALAVNKSMVERAQRAAVCQESSHSTPNAPAARYTSSDAKRTISTAMRQHAGYRYGLVHAIAVECFKESPMSMVTTPIMIVCGLLAVGHRDNLCTSYI
jgi:hypothetical protein